MENLFEIGLEKLLIARKNGDELILGYIDADDKELGFRPQFQNIRLDGPIAPIGVLSSPLDSFCWDTLTFYGASYINKKFPSKVSEQLKNILNDDNVSLWKMRSSYYKAYEFLLSIGITPIIIDKWSDIQVPERNGSLHNLRGPVVSNFPLLNKKNEVQFYLQNKIREEIQTIRVKEKEFSEEEILELFKDYL
jgi:hypothetical protein